MGFEAAINRLRRAKVAVLGPVNPESGSGLFVKMLEQKGAKITLYDPTPKKDDLESEDVKTSSKRSR